jgi:metallo-beta-lactamase family protein
VDGWKHVKIFGEEYDVAAEIVRLDAYSSHADHDGLLGYARSMVQRPRQTFIVHAEMQPAEALRDGMRGMGLENVMIPDRGDVAGIG